MIYLKLDDNKQLKIGQSIVLYEQEQKSDIIKINIDEAFKDYNCYLNILSSKLDSGDIIPVSDNTEYEIENKFLSLQQDLIIWIEMKKEEILLKSSEIILKINEHHSIETIISDNEITMFQKLLEKADELVSDFKDIEEFKTYLDNRLGVPSNSSVKEYVDTSLEKIQIIDDTKIINLFKEGELK